MNILTFGYYFVTKNLFAQQQKRDTLPNIYILLFLLNVSSTTNIIPTLNKLIPSFITLEPINTFIFYPNILSF